MVFGEENVAVAKAAAGEKIAEAKAAAGHVTSKVESAIEEEARKQAFLLISKGIDRAMPRLSRYATRELVDPDMPQAAARGVGAIVDSSMVELKQILTESLTEAVLKQAPDERIELPPVSGSCTSGGICAPCRCIRASIASRRG